MESGQKIALERLVPLAALLFFEGFCQLLPIGSEVSHRSATLRLHDASRSYGQMRTDR